MVSYKNGVVQACGAEALPDFEKRQENVAYWFKVTVYNDVNFLVFRKLTSNESCIYIPP
jgi:hypothetical protein